jgi:hypothetical protein
MLLFELTNDVPESTCVPMHEQHRARRQIKAIAPFPFAVAIRPFVSPFRFALSFRPFVSPFRFAVSFRRFVSPFRFAVSFRRFVSPFRSD